MFRLAELAKPPARPWFPIYSFDFFAAAATKFRPIKHLRLFLTMSEKIPLHLSFEIALTGSGEL